MLPANAAVLLPNIILTPYVPVPETNGEEWDRLEAATGIDALLELVMHGEYNGLDAVSRKRGGLDLRAAAVGVFEVRSTASNSSLSLIRVLEFPSRGSCQGGYRCWNGPSRRCRHVLFCS